MISKLTSCKVWGWLGVYKALNQRYLSFYISHRFYQRSDYHGPFSGKSSTQYKAIIHQNEANAIGFQKNKVRIGPQIWNRKPQKWGLAHGLSSLIPTMGTPDAQYITPLKWWRSLVNVICIIIHLYDVYLQGSLVARQSDDFSWSVLYGFDLSRDF